MLPAVLHDIIPHLRRPQNLQALQLLVLLILLIPLIIPTPTRLRRALRRFLRETPKRDSASSRPRVSRERVVPIVIVNGFRGEKRVLRDVCGRFAGPGAAEVDAENDEFGGYALVEGGESDGHSQN